MRARIALKPVQGRSALAGLAAPNDDIDRTRLNIHGVGLALHEMDKASNAVPRSQQSCRAQAEGKEAPTGTDARRFPGIQGRVQKTCPML